MTTTVYLFSHNEPSSVSMLNIGSVRLNDARGFLNAEALNIAINVIQGALCDYCVWFGINFRFDCTYFMYYGLKRS
jgi:hypothetical protein